MKGYSEKLIFVPKGNALFYSGEFCDKIKNKMGLKFMRLTITRGEGIREVGYGSFVR